MLIAFDTSNYDVKNSVFKQVVHALTPLLVSIFFSGRYIHSHFLEFLGPEKMCKCLISKRKIMNYYFCYFTVISL